MAHLCSTRCQILKFGHFKCGHLFVGYLRKWLENCLEMNHTVIKYVESEVLDIRLSTGFYNLTRSIHFSVSQLSHL